MAAPHTAKTPYDFFTAGNAAFKDSFEKSVAAFGELNAHSKKNLEALVASATAAAKGAETVGARAMAFSKKSMEDQIAAAKALATAKSIQEAVELQTGFAKSAFETLVAEVNEMNELTSTSVKDVFSPINERVTALVEHIRAPR
jgi:phasin family protein